MIVSLVIIAALVVSCGGEAASPAPTEPLEPTAAPITAAEPTEAPVPTEAPAPAVAPTEPPEAPAPTEVPTEPPPTPAPTEPPPPTTAPLQEAESSGSPGTVDLDAIFPPGHGKDLSLMGCTGCHSFVPLVIVQFTPEEWDRNALDHRDRAAAMSDADYEELYQYLKANFGPDDPVPELPQELLDQWTSY